VSILAKILGRSSEANVDVEEAPQEPVDHRGNDRSGAYKVVTVTYPSGYVRKGIVVDLSPSGARLRFSQRGELPDDVELRIEGLSGIRRGQVVWQETHDAGVKFVSQ